MRGIKMRLKLNLFYVIILFGASTQIAFSLHPLTPLTKGEMKTAVSTLKENGLLGNGWYLQLLQLEEPSKEQVLSGNLAAIRRDAFAVVVNTAESKNFEVVIDLSKGKIKKKTPIKRGQPALLTMEYNWTQEIVRNDKRVIQALKKRGIDDINKVYIDTWGVGEFNQISANPKHRIVRAIFFYQDKAVNPYGRPISGLSTVVDLAKRQVVDVIDMGVFDIPKSAEDFFNEEWIKAVSGGVLRENTEIEPANKNVGFSVKR